MDDPRFWQAALAIAAPLSFYFGFRNWRLARLIDDTPLSRVRSAAQGYVELTGIASMGEGVPTIAPLSRLPCAWWLYRIEHQVGEGRNRHWETVNRGVSVAPFLLTDDTGACLVGPNGADVRPGHKDHWRGALPWPTAPGSRQRFFGIGGDYRYTEYRIDERELVSVIGEFRTLGGVNGVDETAEVLRLLSEWKQDQPALLDRFDTNRDGVLSQEEWERARAEARKQIEQRSPRAATPLLSIVVKPTDDRPFLIAASDLKVVARRSRLAAVTMLTGFVGIVMLLATLLLGEP